MSPSEAIEEVFKRNNIKINDDNKELYPKQIYKHIVKKDNKGEE